MKNKDFFALVIIILTAVGLAVLMAGCKTPEKAINYLKKKDKLAEVCAKEYPIKETVIFKAGDTVIQTKEVAGPTITVLDTVIIGGKTVYKDRLVQCPPVKQTTRLVHDTTFVIQESSAKLKVLNDFIQDQSNQLERQEKLIEKQKGKINKWWIVLLIGAALGVSGVFTAKMILK